MVDQGRNEDDRGSCCRADTVVLRLSPAPVAQTAHHQRDRALLRGSATENPTYGVLCERRKCGPHHLLHLPEIQSGMENPHPQPIYTSCLTSPARTLKLTKSGWRYIRFALR